MEQVRTAFISGITSYAPSVFNVIQKILPIALPVMGLLLVVNIALKVFLRILHRINVRC